MLKTNNNAVINMNLMMHQTDASPNKNINYLGDLNET